MSSDRKNKLSEKLHCHPNSKSVGCVSGIFHFFARRYGSSSQKRLQSSSSGGAGRKSKEYVQASKELIVKADSPLRRATLVERLMGLDEFPVTSSPKTSAGSWQRKLLGAVESCEERVTSLKRILEAARAAEERRRVVEDIVGTEVGAEDSHSTVVNCNGEQQPSPASVLDTISPSKFTSHKILKQDITSKDGTTVVESKTSLPSDVGVIFSSEKCHKESKNNPVIRQIAKEGMPRMLKRQSSESLEGFAVAGGGAGPRLWRWGRSRAMVETVCEVLERSAWEERKEAGKVAMALERGIFGDLVDELGAEFAMHSNVAPTRGTCRKRLRF